MTEQIIEALGSWVATGAAVIFTSSLMVGWISGQLDRIEQLSRVSDIEKE